MMSLLKSEATQVASMMTVESIGNSDINDDGESTCLDQGEKEEIDFTSVSDDVDFDELSVMTGGMALDDDFTLNTFSLDSLGALTESAGTKENFSIVHESNSTTVCCVHDQGNGSHGRTGSVAIKVPNFHSDFSEEDQAARNKNEFAISRHLSNCNATRAAISQTEFQGTEAIILEWANGIALSEWIRLLHMKGRSPPLTSHSNCTLICERELKVIIQLATDISNAIAQIHHAGVVHNNFAPENIIVDCDPDNDIKSVKIIGLGSACLLTERCTVNSEKWEDLLSLGSILFEMLTGQSPYRKKCDRKAISKKRTVISDTFLSQNELIHMLTARVPLAIAKIPLTLMEIGDSPDRYDSAYDVGNELSTVKTSLNSIMSNSKNQVNLGQLHFPEGKLYGRDSHLSTLIDVCNSIGTPEGSKMVLVSGYSGVGKSAMVDHAKGILRKQGVSFLSGKFDQLQGMEPLSAIDAALTEYCNNVVQQGPERILEVKKSIFKAIKDDIGVLTEAFPCLCRITGKPTISPTEMSGIAAQNRFKYTFRMLVRAMASQPHPVILSLDDLQWADILSLELITFLVTDVDNDNFLFIGSYRNDEVDDAHPLQTHLNELEHKNIGVTNISVASFSKDDVNNLISDTIKSSQALTKPFSELVYKKTSGNPMFVTQFLLSLWDEGLLHFSLETNSWQWDLQAIETKDVSDTVGELMSKKILQLPIENQYAMKVLACVGSKCDELTLKLCMAHAVDWHGKHSNNNHGNSEYLLLDLAIDEGLLKKEGSYYKFAHDQIQNAAYSLLRENERGLLHKQIGYSILEHVTGEQLNEVLFIVVDQLNRGCIFIEEADKKVELARLNAMAGEKAMSLAAYSSAASYLKAGIDMLCDTNWESHHDICLQLHSLYAESEYCNGHFQEVGRVAGVAITKTNHFQKKLCLYITLIKALGSQNRLVEGIDLGFTVLNELGVQCPSPPPDKAAVMKDFVEIKKMFEDTTGDEFLSHKVMNDQSMIAAMKILHSLSLYTYLAKQEYLPFVITIMLKLTIHHGVCRESCAALAACSFLLVEAKDFKGSEHIGQLAMILFEEMKAKEYLPQIFLALYSGILNYTKEIRRNLDPLLHGYQVGMQTGDIQYGMASAARYVINSFVANRNLEDLSRDIEGVEGQMNEYNQLSICEMILPVKQALLNLTSTIPHVSASFVHQATEEEKLTQQFLQEKKKLLVCELYIFRGIVAYIFGEYKLAADFVEKRQSLEKTMSRTSILYGFVDFYDGLIFLAMAHRSSDAKWGFQAGKSISNVESFLNNGSPNCENKLYLLKAEQKSSLGKKDDALNKYELAITAAKENLFIHEQAVANERLADFLARDGDPRASHFYGEAHNLYLQWGAKCKCDHLCKNIPF